MANTEQKTEQPTRLVRLPEVLKRTGLSRPTIYRSMSAGRFPKSAKIGRVTFWASHELDNWIRDRLAERNPEGIAA